MGFFNRVSSALSSVGSGLFGGGKVDTKFLPYNDLIRSYNMDSGSLFKVKLTGFENTKVTLNKSEGGGITVNSQPPVSPLCEFEVLYSGSDLSIPHEHKYGDAGGLMGMAKNALNAKYFGNSGVTGTGILNAIKGVNDLMKKGGGSTEAFTSFNTFSDFDVAKVYEGNTPPPFNLTFHLMASENPLKEVVIPATLMTYFSYPRVTKSKDIGNLVDMLNQQGGPVSRFLGEALGTSSTTTERDLTRAKEEEEKAKESMNSIFKSIKDVSSDKWRYRVGDTPPVWDISTSNGIIGMKNALMTNITVTYYGPWVEAPDENTIGTFLQEGFQGAGFSPENVFPTSTSFPLKDILSPQGTTGRGGYPTYATVNMTFQHAFGTMFGEEWLSSLTGLKSSKATSSVQTQTPGTVTPPT